MSFSESPHSFRISTVCSPHFGAGPQISPIPIQTHSCQGLRFHLPLLQQYHLPRIHKRTVAPATALSLIIENSTFPLQSFEGKFKNSAEIFNPNAVPVSIYFIRLRFFNKSQIQDFSFSYSAGVSSASASSSSASFAR